MINIIVFGTGSSAEQFLDSIDKERVNVIAFSDNDQTKHHTNYQKCMIIPPEEIAQRQFDYIFVASQYSNEIVPQLIQLGIKANKIIPTDYQKHQIIMNDIYVNANKLVRKKMFTRNKKVKIALQNYNYSKYNGYALYKYMPEYISNKYDVELHEEIDQRKLIESDVIISSDFEGIYDDNHINVETWHGFPLKKMGVLTEKISDSEVSMANVLRRISQTSWFCSYSAFYTTLYNSCFPSDISKFKVTGIPRNDLLFESATIDKLERVIGKDLRNTNLAFYLPTWRENAFENVGDYQDEFELLFGLESGNEDALFQMLKKNNLYLIVKLHSVEMKRFKESRYFNHERIYLLSDDELISHKVHLYEILPAADMLITDYSSVFFDTLLIDIPVIFAPTDIEEYRENRGFLIEPYETMTPGPIVQSMNELDQEVQLILTGEDRYQDERERIRDMVFKYEDNNASERVWKEIDKYIESLGGI